MAACTADPETIVWQELGEQMRLPGTGVPVQDRTHKFRTYKSVFIGSEAVTWLVANRFAKSRQEAVEIGNQLLKNDVFHHAVHEHKFKDDYLFYRFTEDDSIAQKTITGPSVAALMTSGCGISKYGMILKKGMFLWNEKFVVVKQDEEKLYVYASELDASPQYVIDMSKELTQVREVPGAKKNFYGFTVYNTSFSILFAASSSKIQEEWMAAITAAGANLQQEDPDQIPQSTIYEFTCKDVHMKDVPLSTFADKVCLIVNVASK